MRAVNSCRWSAERVYSSSFSLPLLKVCLARVAAAFFHDLDGLVQHAAAMNRVSSISEKDIVRLSVDCALGQRSSSNLSILTRTTCHRYRRLVSLLSFLPIYRSKSIRLECSISALGHDSCSSSERVHRYLCLSIHHEHDSKSHCFCTRRSASRASVRSFGNSPRPFH